MIAELALHRHRSGRDGRLLRNQLLTQQYSLEGSSGCRDRILRLQRQATVRALTDADLDEVRSCRTQTGHVSTRAYLEN